MNFSASVSNEARIAVALERIATALERPVVLPIYRTSLDQAHEIADYLQAHAPHITPLFINTTTQEEPEHPAGVIGLVG